MDVETTLNLFLFFQINVNGLRNEFEYVNQYPNLFNYCVLFSGNERALAEFLLHYKWTRVGFLCISNSERFSDDYFRVCKKKLSQILFLKVVFIFCYYDYLSRKIYSV